MADFYIRGMDEDIKSRLTQQAKTKGLSLNRYVCSILSDYALHPELKYTEDRYAALAKNITAMYEQLQDKTTDALAEVITVLDLVLERLDEQS